MPQPIFFNEIKFIPSLEVAMHRGIWSFFILFLFLLFLNDIYDFFKLFKSLKNIIILTITSLLIATNWLGFIYAVSIDKVQDASLGYFLTPLISISLGYLILGENLNLRKNNLHDAVHHEGNVELLLLASSDLSPSSSNHSL